MTREIYESISALAGKSDQAALDTLASAVGIAADAGIPAGGTTNQILSKTSAADYVFGWSNPAGPSRSLVPTARAVLATSFTANSTTWANVDTNADLVIAAATGDVLQVSVSGEWQSNTTTYGLLDAVSVVSGAAVNSITGGTGQASDYGLICAYGRYASDSNGSVTCFGGNVQYVVQAGDIDTGSVRLRLQAKALPSGSRVMSGGAGRFQWHVTNWGH